jgi:hypothetical protein
MHSYHALYESGQITLRKADPRKAVAEFKFGDRIVKRPLRIVSNHARDIYPSLLRSILLIRLIAAYEAFLIDAIKEISYRSKTPFMNDSRIDLSHGELLHIDSTEGILSYIVKRKLRSLTSGGLIETRKFYRTNLKADLVPTDSDFGALRELHDRRHLYVHRSGYADAEYVHRYPESGSIDGQIVPVSEAYLMSGIGVIEVSALHIKRTLEQQYPGPAERIYVSGNVEIGDQFELMQFVSFNPLNGEARKKYLDLSLSIGGGLTLGDIVVWLSTDDYSFRMVVAGDSINIGKFRRLLRAEEKGGSIALLDHFKIKRKKKTRS